MMVVQNKDGANMFTKIAAIFLLSITSAFAQIPAPAGTAKAFDKGYSSCTFARWMNNVVDLGPLTFGGPTINSVGFKGLSQAVAKITIPNPLPPGWKGKTVTVVVTDIGNYKAEKQIFIEKYPCSFATKPLDIGVTPHANITFQGVGVNGITVQPGEVWFVNIAARKAVNGWTTQTCAIGSDYKTLNCDFGIRLTTPDL